METGLLESEMVNVAGKVLELKNVKFRGACSYLFKL